MSSLLNVTFSPIIRSLLQQMLAESPMDRPTIAQIKAHPWYNGPVMLPEKVYQEISSRRIFPIKDWQKAIPILYEKYLNKKKEEQTKLAMAGKMGDSEGKKSFTLKNSTIKKTADRVLKDYKVFFSS